MILDLDETLIHATESPLATRCDFVVDRFYVHLRPGVRHFLAWCDQHFDVGIWTTANDAYAHEMVECILPAGMDLVFLWSEQECELVDVDEQHVALVKDLDRLDSLGTPLQETLVVDDTPEKLAYHLDNLIPMPAFLGDRSDRHLIALQHYLEFMRSEPDVYAHDLADWLSHPSLLDG